MQKKLLTTITLFFIIINLNAQDAAVKDLQSAAGKEVKSY